MAKKYKCPFPEYTHKTGEVTDALASVLLSVHSTGTHTAPEVTKLEKVRHPTISASGSSKDWSYFLTCWDDYVAATNLVGKDKVI